MRLSETLLSFGGQGVRGATLQTWAASGVTSFHEGTEPRKQLQEGHQKAEKAVSPPPAKRAGLAGQGGAGVAEPGPRAAPDGGHTSARDIGSRRDVQKFESAPVFPPLAPWGVSISPGMKTEGF